MEPPLRLYHDLLKHARSKGLTRRAAETFATLGWWGAYYGFNRPVIHSGKRSRKNQQALIKEWATQGSNGPNRLTGPPAAESRHMQGNAWDVSRLPADELHAYGYWIEHFLNGRWGGNFQRPSPLHFDV